MEEFPIIYLRGYAGDQRGVEATVDDPFYGFNTGSTHVRVGERGQSEFFAFESPVVRLMSDHRYEDVYSRGRQPSQERPGASAPRPKSIWIHRYYDVTSESFDNSQGIRLEIEKIAQQLKQTVTFVKELTGAKRVILVAHSMGGLIARCLIQKVYRDEAPNIEMPALAHIDKVFTYGTPHGGIHFDVSGGDFLERARDWVGRNNMDDFGRTRMYEYLTPKSKRRKSVPKDFDELRNSLDGAFPPERFFCLVGTNAKDYEAAMGWSSKIVGPQSDGLVQIRHAYIKGSPRAYVHRAHSGRYGILNSEEGYQNLRRFLFGDMRVELFLDKLDRLRDFPPESGVTHQAEARVAIRRLPVLMHDQTTEHHSPILLELEKLRAGEPIPLFTVFLIPKEAPDERTCQYGVVLGVHREHRENGFLILRDHLEQVPLWRDELIVDLVQEAPGTYTGRYAWRSSQRDPEAGPDQQLTWRGLDDRVEVRLRLPPRGRELLGDNAELLMRASPWI